MLKIRLKLEVEHEGAKFFAKPLDGIIPAVLEALKDEQIQQLSDIKEANLDSLQSVPTSLIGLIIDVFNQALIGWEGIVDDEEKPIEFNEENVKLIPSSIKLEVGAKLLNEMVKINEKKGE